MKFHLDKAGKLNLGNWKIYARSGKLIPTFNRYYSYEEIKKKKMSWRRVNDFISFVLGGLNGILILVG